jgi:hypothetical protein
MIFHPDNPLFVVYISLPLAFTKLVSDWPTRALALELICITIRVNSSLKPWNV